MDTMRLSTTTTMGTMKKGTMIGTTMRGTTTTVTTTTVTTTTVVMTTGSTTIDITTTGIVTEVADPETAPTRHTRCTEAIRRRRPEITGGVGRLPIDIVTEKWKCGARAELECDARFVHVQL